MQPTTTERTAPWPTRAAKYTDEFRREIADYIISTGRLVAECCSELGLNSKTVNSWVQKRRRELAGEPDPGGQRAASRARPGSASASSGWRTPSRKKPRPSSPKSRVDARYRLMLAERAGFPIKLMARILGAGMPGLYSWLSSGCLRDGWSAEREAVHRVWLESDRRFGVRFMECFLPAEFSRPSLCRVRRLVRELGIRGCTPNAKKRAAIPGSKARLRLDLVRRDSTSPVPTYKPVGDITNLRTGEGWLHLATAIGLNTRMAGWSPSERMTADIAVAALASAKARGYVAGNAMFHSDRGA